MLDRYDQDLLLGYLEGELDAGQRAQLDALLAEDPQLAALLGAIVKDRDALRSLPRAESPRELVHDVTQSLERRMLLDENALPEAGPIPIARGRDLPGEPTGGPNWGRIVGLSALAASVALAAGIVVITMNNDPLENVADRLGTSNQTPTQEPVPDPAGGFASSGNTQPGLDPAPSAAGNPVQPESPAIVFNPDQGGGNTLGDNLPERIALDTSPAVPDPSVPGRFRFDHQNQPDGGFVEAIDAARLGAPAQPTIALAVTEPRQQLVLFTEEPELTQEQLVAFCVANGIPIVQTNLDNNGGFGWSGNKQLALLSKAQQAGDPAADPATPDAPEAKPIEPQAGLVANYALLIDEQKLEELVQDFNARATPKDAERPGRQRALASNQAAYLADLEPGKTLAIQQAAQIAPLNVADQPANAPARDKDDLALADESDNSSNPRVQQAIELRLPSDLGSPYANSLNKTNLDVIEKRRGYTNAPYGPNNIELSERRADASIGKEEPNTPPKPGHDADANNADLAGNKPDVAGELTDGTNAQTTEAERGLDERLSEKRGGDAGATPDDREERDALQPSSRREAAEKLNEEIDLKRGNWLSAHLPLADTTPLLQWRAIESQRSPQLVPILIQQVPSEQVNSLRLQVQIEQLRRDNAAALESNRSEKPAEDTPADATPDPAEPVDALRDTPTETPAETPTEPGSNP